jgi:serine/threonine-protein kinase
LIALVGGVLLARRNARLKRGDRSGAWKLALFEFAALALSWALSTHPVSNATTNWNFTVGGLGRALFWAAFLWLLYMALEPAVRRRWPRILVSWNRFLDGDTRDPLVTGLAVYGFTAALDRASAPVAAASAKAAA